MLFLQRFQSLLLGTTAPCAFLSKVQGVFRVNRYHMAKTNLRPQPQQLDLFQVQAEYPKQIIDNTRQKIDLYDLDLTQNVLSAMSRKTIWSISWMEQRSYTIQGNVFHPQLHSINSTTSYPTLESNVIRIISASEIYT